jgi:hypothetical protein
LIGLSIERGVGKWIGEVEAGGKRQEAKTEKNLSAPCVLSVK